MKVHTIVILSILSILFTVVVTLLVLYNAELARLNATVTPFP